MNSEIWYKSIQYISVMLHTDKYTNQFSNKRHFITICCPGKWKCCSC